MSRVYNYRGYNCELEFKEYISGQRAIQLVSGDEGAVGVVAVVTVAVHESIQDGYITVKDYSENDGMLDFLIEEGIVEKPEYTLPYGYVDIPVCKLLIEE